MSSGSYFPPPVRAVEIPKPHGAGMRMLGIPAVSDRVAQTVVARHLMRRVEPVFHPDSYGYRPGRSALDAVGKCRERCWKRDWVVEFDIARFFDSVPWDLLVKAVEAHTDAVWVKLYVRGGSPPRSSCPTAPCWNGSAGPRKGPRFLPFWRICSCTTRSTPGWTGSSRAV